MKLAQAELLITFHSITWMQQLILRNSRPVVSELLQREDVSSVVMAYEADNIQYLQEKDT